MYELRKLKLYELGPTPIGANPDTDLLAVKTATHQLARLARGFKAGRVLSAKNEITLREARDQLTLAADRIDAVLSAPDSSEEPGMPEEASVGELAERRGVSPATARLLTDLDFLAAG